MPLLALPQPYDFELSTGRYRAFGPDLANLWLDGALYRAVDGREVRIAAAEGGVDVQPLDETIRPTVFTLLGGPFDLDAFRAFAVTEPVLSRVVAALPGLRPPLAPDPFESLVTSVTAQQVSLHAAFAIRNRLIVAFGREALPRSRAHRRARPAAQTDSRAKPAHPESDAASGASRVYAFPTREKIAAAAPVELTALGFSRRKAECVIGVARSELDLDALAALPDDEVKNRLVALTGIGEWTADWFLARHLARPRAWPAGDLGLRKAVDRFYGVNGDIRALAERFAPFENLSAHYLLTALLTGLTP